MTPRHVVLVGAARSGTKILREALAASSGSGRVPYDIGYVWRYGNEGHPDDALRPECSSEKSARFIRHFVDRYADGQPSAVIEKTVGNTLRIPFVAKMLPDASYVHLIRNGVDVIESTRRQWTEPTDVRYLLAKARHFPLRLVPGYGVKYLQSLARRRTSAERRVGSWGPRYPGIDDDLRHEDLLTVCARQWRTAVTQARADLGRLTAPVTEIRYERLVQDPRAELTRLVDFLDLDVSAAGLAAAAASITPERQDVGRCSLDAGELAVVQREAGSLLAHLDYPVALVEDGPRHER